MSAFLRLRTQRDVDTSRAHPRGLTAPRAPPRRRDSLRAILGDATCWFDDRGPRGSASAIRAGSGDLSLEPPASVPVLSADASRYYVYSILFE